MISIFWWTFFLVRFIFKGISYIKLKAISKWGMIYSESEFTLEPYVYFVQELFLGIKGWIETSLNRKKPRRTLMGSITLSRILSAGKSWLNRKDPFVQWETTIFWEIIIPRRESARAEPLWGPFDYLTFWKSNSRNVFWNFKYALETGDFEILKTLYGAVSIAGGEAAQSNGELTRFSC